MGEVVSKKLALKVGKPSFRGLTIFCCELGGITDDAVSLNVNIARRLADVSPRMRSMCLESCFVSALSELPEGVVIRDIDALFSPAYEVDAMTLLCDAYRKHRFDLVWPGRLEGNHLVYAEESSPDYKAFDVDRYDITCIY